eukprot:9100535-Pyramimonas_sp.AAC.1
MRSAATGSLHDTQGRSLAACLVPSSKRAWRTASDRSPSHRTSPYCFTLSRVVITRGSRLQP